MQIAAVKWIRLPCWGGGPGLQALSAWRILARLGSDSAAPDQVRGKLYRSEDCQDLLCNRCLQSFMNNFLWHAWQPLSGWSARGRPVPLFLIPGTQRHRSPPHALYDWDKDRQRPSLHRLRQRPSLHRFPAAQGDTYDSGKS